MNRVQIDAGITSEDLNIPETEQLIRNAEEWIIGELEMAELWGRVEQLINSGNIPRQLSVTGTLYSSALCIQRVFGSAGIRSQTNYPDSFQSWSAGGLSASQPDWKTVYNNKIKTARETLEKYIKYLQGEEQTQDAVDGMAVVSNRDFEAHWDKAFGFGVGDFDFF